MDCTSLVGFVGSGGGGVELKKRTYGSACTRSSVKEKTVSSNVRVGGVVRMDMGDQPAIDMSKSGLKFLSEDARMRAVQKKANPFEKMKAEKCGSSVWEDVFKMSAAIREGKTSWEELDLDDRDKRLKWIGLFHRAKATPGRFMMRLRVPNGELTADQLDFFASVVEKYGDDGVADITTRQNIQLRGIQLEDAGEIIDGLRKLGLTSVQSGMDNLRNMVGNPLAGIDPLELCDTRPFMQAIQDMVTNSGDGNAELTNLPRKFNISMNSTLHDNFAHTHINDLGLDVAEHPSHPGELGFNAIVGGMFSGQRAVMSIPLDLWVPQNLVVPFCKAVLEVFRDHGPRATRTKCRLMYYIDEVGIDTFREQVIAAMNLTDEQSATLDKAAPAPAGSGHHRSVVGVHPQKQEGLSWVGCCVPVGRMTAADMREVSRLTREYGDGTCRVTVGQDIVFPNISNDKVSALTAEPLLTEKFLVSPGRLVGSLVSCTGAQFCPFGLVETKQRAHRIAKKLEERIDLSRDVRIHWTGCPNSCGQAQIGEIGLMGAPARVDGKAVEGVRVMLGGEIGSAPELATQFEKAVPADDESLVPYLEKILVEKFGATPKSAA